MQFAVINLPLLAAAADRLGLVRELAQTLARPAPSLWAEGRPGLRRRGVHRGRRHPAGSGLEA